MPGEPTFAVETTPWSDFRPDVTEKWIPDTILRYFDGYWLWQTRRPGGTFSADNRLSLKRGEGRLEVEPLLLPRAICGGVGGRAAMKSLLLWSDKQALFAVCVIYFKYIRGGPSEKRELRARNYRFFAWKHGVEHVGFLRGNRNNRAADQTR